MNVLITGGTGFVGNNLARSHVARGDRVGLLVRPEKYSWRLKDLETKVEKIEVFLDLEYSDNLRRKIMSFGPDRIYHLATYGAYPLSQQDSDKMLKTNVGATLSLVDAAEGIPLLNIGSSSEYGEKQTPMQETDSCRPNNDYGRTKLAQTLYCKEQGIPTLRLFSVYGPWEQPSRLIPTLMRAKFGRRKLSLINSVREYAYIDDIVDGIIAAGDNYSQIKGEILNLGSGKEYSMKDVLGTLDLIDPTELDISWNFDAPQKEPPRWVSNSAKAKRLLHWSTTTSLKEGLQKTYEWNKNRLLRA